MTSCVDTLTEKVSYVEHVKKGMALHYLEIMSVHSVLPTTMAGHCMQYFLSFCQSLHVFYLVIVTFQISATSGPLNVFIFSAQMIASVLNTHDSLFYAYASQSWFQVMQKILITFYSVWNLDFFYSVIPTLKHYHTSFASSAIFASILPTASDNCNIYSY